MTKRLGRMISCPVCYTVVNPVVVAEYPENKRAAIPIPPRTVLQCPTEECQRNTTAVWYVVADKIEELPLATDSD